VIVIGIVGWEPPGLVPFREIATSTWLWAVALSLDPFPPPPSLHSVQPPPISPPFHHHLILSLCTRRIDIDSASSRPDAKFGDRQAIGATSHEPRNRTNRRDLARETTRESQIEATQPGGRWSPVPYHAIVQTDTDTTDTTQPNPLPPVPFKPTNQPTNQPSIPISRVPFYSTLSLLHYVQPVVVAREDQGQRLDSTDQRQLLSASRGRGSAPNRVVPFSHRARESGRNRVKI
jgi:hypothetical protein